MRLDRLVLSKLTAKLSPRLEPAAKLFARYRVSKLRSMLFKVMPIHACRGSVSQLERARKGRVRGQPLSPRPLSGAKEKPPSRPRTADFGAEVDVGTHSTEYLSWRCLISQFSRQRCCCLFGLCN